MELAKKALDIAPSATLKAAALAKELKSQGKDIISLTVGEPDFFTPDNIRIKAITSITNGKASFYTIASGLPELKEALQAFVEKDYGLHYKTSQFLVSPGAKFALYSAFTALLNPEDEVLVPVPYWVSYSEQIKLAGGKPIFVQPKDKKTNKVTPEDLEKFLTKKTKVLLLNSPSNPTGMIYSKEELEALGDFVIEHDLFVVADDIYSHLIYDGVKFTSMAMISKEMKERTLVITGVSKTYSMTGWRIGFAFGPENLIQAMATIQSHATSNPAAVSQYAALEAIAGSQEPAEKMRQAFEKRLEKAYQLVIDLPGFSLVKPQGAFYLFPDITKAMADCNFKTVDDFVEALLLEAGVAVVSGTGFGADHAIRLSYAVSEEVFAKGIFRIKKFLEKKMKA